MYGLIEVIPIKKNNLLILVSIIIMLLVFAASYYIFIISNEQKERSEEEPIKTFDNRISPDINQGLTVEVLRIRNRGLLERMLVLGTSWKKTPKFLLDYRC